LTTLKLSDNYIYVGSATFFYFLSFLACLGLRARKKKVGCPPGTTFSDVQITSLVYYICLFGHIWHNRIKMLFYYYFKKLRIYRENNYLPYPCFLDTHVLVLDQLLKSYIYMIEKITLIYNWFCEIEFDSIQIFILKHQKILWIIVYMVSGRSRIFFGWATKTL
jgi:hypothetical protein